LLIEQFEQNNLGDPARVLSGAFKEPYESIDDLLRSDNPSGSRTWRNYLRERIEAQDTPVHIDTQKRWDKDFEKFIVAGGKWY
jgi:hypothetical protein